MELIRPTCRLRLPQPADAESLAGHGNDWEIWLNLRDRFPHPYTVPDATSYIARVAGQDPVTSFGIVVDGQAVGGISLMPGTDIERVGAELGYWVGRAYGGRGIITDAIGGVTEYAFGTLGLERVFALPFTRNAASARALEKAGYVREGLMRHSATKDGQLLDQYLYAAYRDQWAGPDSVIPRSP